MTLILLKPQAETINRLLKKQSTRQMKNKRFGGASLTHTAAATPAQATSDVEEGEGAEGDADAEEEEEDDKRREPEMYRWVSNAAGLLFSVPVGILPSTPEGGGNGMVVDSSTSSRTSKKFRSEPKSTPAPPPLCDVRNCGEVRKYRLVSDWEKGACGMVHLQVLQ